MATSQSGCVEGEQCSAACDLLKPRLQLGCLNPIHKNRPAAPVPAAAVAASSCRTFQFFCPTHVRAFRLSCLLPAPPTRYCALRSHSLLYRMPLPALNSPEMPTVGCRVDAHPAADRGMRWRKGVGEGRLRAIDAVARVVCMVEWYRIAVRVVSSESSVCVSRRSWNRKLRGQTGSEGKEDST